MLLWSRQSTFSMVRVRTQRTRHTPAIIMVFIFSFVSLMYQVAIDWGEKCIERCCLQQVGLLLVYYVHGQTYLYVYVCKPIYILNISLFPALS